MEFDVYEIDSEKNILAIVMLFLYGIGASIVLAFTLHKHFYDLRLIAIPLFIFYIIRTLYNQIRIRETLVYKNESFYLKHGLFGKSLKKLDCVNLILLGDKEDKEDKVVHKVKLFVIDFFKVLLSINRGNCYLKLSREDFYLKSKISLRTYESIQKWVEKCEPRV